MRDGIAIVILGGGEARRFPGKLERELGGTPMIVRIFRAMRATGYPVFVAGKGSFESQVDAALECPLLVDRWPGSGPLAALVSACGSFDCAPLHGAPLRMTKPGHVFAVAGDEPLVDGSLLEALEAAWQDGDRAVVPEHDGRVEPLAGLYETSSVLHEGFTLLSQDRTSMHDLLDRLSARRVSVSARYFANVNVPADLERAGASTA